MEKLFKDLYKNKVMMFVENDDEMVAVTITFKKGAYERSISLDPRTFNEINSDISGLLREYLKEFVLSIPW